MTHTEQPQAEYPRNGGLKLLLAFVGGALAGGVAAMLFAPLSGAETRRRIAGAMGDTKEAAGRLPHAIRDASSAAQAAFAAALKEGVKEDEDRSSRSAPRHHS